jgi:hypothetical protein
MRLKAIVSVCLCLCFAATLIARQDKSDSVSGVWFGYYGTNPRDQAQVRLTLHWDGKVLTGNVTTGDDPFDLENTKFDPSSGAIHIEVVELTITTLSTAKSIKIRSAGFGITKPAKEISTSRRSASDPATSTGPTPVLVARSIRCMRGGGYPTGPRSGAA